MNEAAIGVAALWLVWGVVWALAALRTKPTRRHEPLSSRALGALLGLAAGLVFVGHGYLPDWLGKAFLPRTPALEAVGVILAAAGIWFAIRARLAMGGNWSGTITLKEGHELVRTGPFAIVRHPIYAGILVAVAIVFGRRVVIEDRWMAEEFGPEWDRYRAEVPALLPRFGRRH